jgi:hypothetical protein
MRIPLFQSAQVDAPLPLIRFHPAAALHQPETIFDHTDVSLWPAQLQRVVAISCAMTVSCRLSTAPASCHFSSKKMQSWAVCIQLRVIGGLLCRIQVQFCSCAAIATTIFSVSRFCIHLRFFVSNNLLTRPAAKLLQQGSIIPFAVCPRRDVTYPTTPSPPHHHRLIVQAAAAARIEGEPGILAAAASGDVELVRDCCIADPDTVHSQDWL